MQSNEIMKGSLMDTGKIDMHHVFSSVLSEGVKQKLFDIHEVQRIQTQLMTLLGKLVTKFTNGQSSSVRTDTAQRIMNSILYVLDIRLMHDFDADTVVDILKRSPVEVLHDEGMMLIETMYAEADELMHRVDESRLPIDMISYHDSIDSIKNDFFAETAEKKTGRKKHAPLGAYDPWFDAGNAIASIDYPLLSDDMSWEGIVYIKGYLHKLKMENEFLHCYDIADIRHIMALIGRKAHIPCQELLVNLAEAVLLNSICSVMLGKEAKSIHLSEVECNLLLNALKTMKSYELQSAIDGAFKLVMSEVRVQNDEMQIYFKDYVQKLGPRFGNAVCQRSMSGLLAIEQARTQTVDTYYQGGSKLDDEKFREIVEELLACENGRQKADILLSEIGNIEDLMDIFNANCIFGEEYETIFQAFDSMTLALIVSNIDEIRECSADELRGIVFDHLNDTENEIYWKERLIDYLACCEPQRRNDIISEAKGIKTL